MTKLFEKAVATTSKLPAEMQDDIASIMLSLAGEDLPPIELSDEEIVSFEKSRAQAARREFSPDSDVQAVWSKHGL
ncbi:MAG: hypothetical protein JWL86_3947 [Rhizobium sp.]|nr:hypothetical protein [Rhizobium sp.]